MVIDFCVQIPHERIHAFMTKWNLSPENEGSQFTKEQQMQCESENPLNIPISPQLILNGKTIGYTRGCGLSWNPCFPQCNGEKSQAVCKQYQLDCAYGWVIHRYKFPWRTTRKPQISSLSVVMKRDPVEILGPHFHVSAPGDVIHFTHPITMVEHTLTVQRYTQEEMPQECFENTDYVNPTYYTAMGYTLYPQIEEASFLVRDLSEGDRPRKKQINPNEPQCKDSCGVFTLIDDTCGENTILFGGSEQGKLHSVCSALYFKPIDAVKWQIVFDEKLCTDTAVQLI